MLEGQFNKLEAYSAERPDHWREWLAAEFPGAEPFKAFMIVHEESTPSECQARIRLRKASGSAFAVFADFDSQLQLRRLRSVREMLEDRKLEMQAAIDDIAEALPRHRSGGVDDVSLLPLMRRLAELANKSQGDVTKYIQTLEGGNFPGARRVSRPRR